MQDFHALPIGQKCPQRLQVLKRKRIDEGTVFERSELYETQFRVVGAFTHELGVERDEFARTERVQRIVQRVRRVHEDRCLYTHGAIEASLTQRRDGGVTAAWERSAEGTIVSQK
jgi:hypothetical protein